MEIKQKDRRISWLHESIGLIDGSLKTAEYFAQTLIL